VVTSADLARRKFAYYVSRHGGDRIVADYLGCSRSYVNLIRRGIRRPGIGIAAAIARVTNIPAEYWDQSFKPRKSHDRR
jgi:transcriptional regulator with XRE-family HTH domain